MGGGWKLLDIITIGGWNNQRETGKVENSLFPVKHVSFLHVFKTMSTIISIFQELIKWVVGITVGVGVEKSSKIDNIN